MIVSPRRIGLQPIIDLLNVLAKTQTPEHSLCDPPARIQPAHNDLLLHQVGLQLHQDRIVRDATVGFEALDVWQLFRLQVVMDSVRDRLQDGPQHVLFLCEQAQADETSSHVVLPVRRIHPPERWIEYYSAIRFQ